MTKVYTIINEEEQIAEISETVQVENKVVLSVEQINTRISEIDNTITILNAEKTQLQTDLTEITNLLS